MKVRFPREIYERLPGMNARKFNYMVEKKVIYADVRDKGTRGASRLYSPRMTMVAGLTWYFQHLDFDAYLSAASAYMLISDTHCLQEIVDNKDKARNMVLVVYAQRPLALVPAEEYPKRSPKYREFALNKECVSIPERMFMGLPRDGPITFLRANSIIHHVSSLLQVDLEGERSYLLMEKGQEDDLCPAEVREAVNLRFDQMVKTLGLK